MTLGELRKKIRNLEMLADDVPVNFYGSDFKEIKLEEAVINRTHNIRSNKTETFVSFQFQDKGRKNA